MPEAILLPQLIILYYLYLLALPPNHPLYGQEWSSLLAQGNEQAFRDVYARYWQPLYRVAYNRVRSAPVAEELVQDVFVSLWEKRKTLQVHTSLPAYLFTALRYSVLDYIRSSAVRERYVEEILSQATQADPAADAILGLQDLEEAYTKALESLPEKCRQVFALSRQKNFSVSEIARQLAISPKTAENQITKALRLLRRSLREFLPLLLLWLYDRV